MTEEEASANRKQRRSQMNKMKKSVEKALEANTAKYGNPGANAGVGKSTAKARNPGDVHSTFPQSHQTLLQKFYQEIREKQVLVQEYEDRVNKLVQAMRVSDLRQCPRRLVSKTLEESNRNMYIKTVK